MAILVFRSLICGSSAKILRLVASNAIHHISNIRHRRPATPNSSPSSYTDTPNPIPIDTFSSWPWAGGVCDIDNAHEDDHVISLAKLALHKQNKNQNTQVQFVRVVKANSGIRFGMLYNIMLEASDGASGEKTFCCATVWDRSYTIFKRLEFLKWTQDVPSDDWL